MTIVLVIMASKKGKKGVGDKGKKFNPKNQLRLADSELREFLSLRKRERSLMQSRNINVQRGETA